MLEQFSSADSVAFETACGQFTFSADFNNNWQLALLQPDCYHPRDSRSYRCSLSEAATSVRFVVDRQNNLEGYVRPHASSDPASIPCILKTLEGVPNDNSHDWTERDVRRYVLLLKLFGKPAADSG